LSKASRISLMYIVILYSLYDMYGEKRKDELQKNFAELLNSYGQEIPQKVYDHILKILYEIEKDISAQKFKGTYKFLYAFSECVCQRFLDYVTGDRYKAWKKFENYVAKHKSLRTKGTKSLEAAEKALELLVKYEEVI
jgi:hypothetical protein